MTIYPFTLWVFLTLWVVCGVLSAVLAKGKGRSLVGWLLLGFLPGVLGPRSSLLCSLPSHQARGCQRRITFPNRH
jgi:hypothetical protein